MDDFLRSLEAHTADLQTTVDKVTKLKERQEKLKEEMASLEASLDVERIQTTERVTTVQGLEAELRMMRLNWEQLEKNKEESKEKLLALVDQLECQQSDGDAAKAAFVKQCREMDEQLVAYLEQMRQ